jgi:hypothetical protein
MKAWMRYFARLFRKLSDTEADLIKREIDIARARHQAVRPLQARLRELRIKQLGG